MDKSHLDKIGRFIFEDTKIVEFFTGKYMLPPFFSIKSQIESSSNPYIGIHVVHYLNTYKNPTKTFKHYCINTYILDDSDIDYVWGIYRKELITNLSIDLNEKNLSVMYVTI